MQRVVVDLACEAKRGHLRATDENLRNRLRREVLGLMRAAVSNVFARKAGAPRVPSLDDLRNRAGRSGRPGAARKRPKPPGNALAARGTDA